MIAQALMDAGEDPNAKSGIYRNPLCAAIACGHPDVAVLLGRKGARLTGTDAASALCIAAQKGFVEVVRMLIDHGVDVNSGVNAYPPHFPDEFVATRGLSPLHIANIYSAHDVAPLLSEHGATFSGTFVEARVFGPTRSSQQV